jgi:hypothetical protein
MDRGSGYITFNHFKKIETAYKNIYTHKYLECRASV